MNNEQYPYLTNANKVSFEFVSQGPNGKIKKEVRYIAENEESFIFNLAFGDLNDETNELDDFTVSNNGDRDKILATVAATVLEFTQYFPQAFIYAKGSTVARTRLYQMAITQNLKQILDVLYVYGLRKNTWSKFEIEVTYEAFMVLRK
ncbi:DUF6934 family protein [Pedobacter nyackensis]|uniref:DUF6934 family protein n=1 Tax=Pedobacter nyackensis TaxID=475255 RepID=UPI00293038FF|nr:hypothetical protein [Pedobacter nyackensis]